MLFQELYINGLNCYNNLMRLEILPLAFTDTEIDIKGLTNFPRVTKLVDLGLKVSQVEGNSSTKNKGLKTKFNIDLQNP